MLQTDGILNLIRKELKKVSPDVKITNDEIKDVLVNEVIKREVIEGDKATNATKKIARVSAKAVKATK